MKTNLLFLFWLLLTTAGSYAQKSPAPSLPMAQPGRNGVFVQIAKTLHGPRYRIERTETATTGWQTIATTDEAPANAPELRARLRLLATKNPIYELPSDTVLARLWPRVQRTATTDSLGVFGLHPLVLEALGLAWFDADAKPNTRYDYRITALDPTAERTLPTTKPVSFPGAKPAFGARLIRATGTGADVRLQFLITRPRQAGPPQAGSGPPVGMVRVMRGIYAQTDMREVPARWGFRLGQRDSLIVEVTDTDVQKRMIYQYALIPTDLLGNEGSPSDTATVTNLRPFVDLPTIKAIAGQSDEARHAVKLSWKLSDGLRGLRSINVLRSDDYDGPYRPVATLSPTDTVYVDTQVRPVEMHYYQLILNGNYDQSPASVRVAGMLNASEDAIFAPTRLLLDRTKDSIKLTWHRNGGNTRGYIVYRSTSVNGELRPVTSVILSADSVMTFTQKISELPPAPMYAFAVAAENTSYRIGPLSDRVTTGAVVPTRLATPLNLRVVNRKTATGTNHALIAWQEMRAIDRYIQHYTIFRKADTEKAFTLLYHQTDDDLNRNSFVDSTVVTGKRYSYRVQANGLGDVVSAFSADADYFEPLPPVLTPLGLRVFALGDGKGIRISWDAPAQAAIASYRVYRQGPTGQPVVVATVAAPTTQRVDARTDTGTRYFYQVSALTASGQESPLSDPVGVDW
jgi:hypothetical protein